MAKDFHEILQRHGYRRYIKGALRSSWIGPSGQSIHLAQTGDWNHVAPGEMGGKSTQGKGEDALEEHLAKVRSSQHAEQLETIHITPERANEILAEQAKALAPVKSPVVQFTERSGQYAENPEYRGFKLEPFEGIQIGHKLPNARSLKQQLGHGTRRKLGGVIVSHPEHYPNGKHFDTYKAARQWIDEFHGGPEDATQHAERNLDVPTQHQLKIARKTLKMHDAGAVIMGGMTKHEALALLQKHAPAEFAKFVPQTPHEIEAHKKLTSQHAERSAGSVVSGSVDPKPDYNKIGKEYYDTLTRHGYKAKRVGGNFTEFDRGVNTINVLHDSDKGHHPWTHYAGAGRKLGYQGHGEEELHKYLSGLHRYSSNTQHAERALGKGMSEEALDADTRQSDQEHTRLQQNKRLLSAVLKKHRYERYLNNAGTSSYKLGSGQNAVHINHDTGEWTHRGPYKYMGSEIGGSSTGVGPESLDKHLTSHHNQQYSEIGANAVPVGVVQAPVLMRKGKSSQHAESSKKRTHYRNGEEIGLSGGCDGCSPSRINGVLSHESGCPHAWKDHQVECKNCGTDFFPTERGQGFCGEDCANSYYG